MSENSRKYEAWQCIGPDRENRQDELVVEAPLTILVGDEPLTVTMQTPGHELDLVRGLLYTEGIWKRSDRAPQIKFTEFDSRGNITRAEVEVNDGKLSSVNKRSLLSVSACGICGKTTFEPPQRENAALNRGSLQIPVDQLFRLMRTEQFLFSATGGCHAAAAFTGQGEMLGVREDIGRHNAVDKVVGMLLTQGRLKDAFILTVSGRVSYEIIAKAFAAGIPVIAAVSSVSSLAVDFAKELGISLLGFCREGRATVYAGPERLFG